MKNTIISKIRKKLGGGYGFTLIEMLIVVAIIAILVAVAIPAVSSNLEKARKAADDANFRTAKTVAMIMNINGMESDGSSLNYAPTYWYWFDEKTERPEKAYGGDKPYKAKSDGTNRKKGDKIVVKFYTNKDPEVFWAS